MLNFGDGKNIAEHFYDNLVAGSEHKGGFYMIFHNAFLTHNTVHLCFDSDKKFFIFDTPKSGYLYKTRWRADIVNYQPKEEIVLRWKYTKKEHTFKFDGMCYR